MTLEGGDDPVVSEVDPEGEVESFDWAEEVENDEIQIKRTTKAQALLTFVLLTWLSTFNVVTALGSRVTALQTGVHIFHLCRQCV